MGWEEDRGGAGLKYVWIRVGLGQPHRSAPWENHHGHEDGTPPAGGLGPPSQRGGITDCLFPQGSRDMGDR